MGNYGCAKVTWPDMAKEMHFARKSFVHSNFTYSFDTSPKCNTEDIATILNCQVIFKLLAILIQDTLASPDTSLSTLQHY